MSKIICGTNEVDGGRYVGKTVTQIKDELKDLLGIPEGATVLRNSDPIGEHEDQTMRPGDQIEFVRTAGEKG